MRSHSRSTAMPITASRKAAMRTAAAVAAAGLVAALTSAPANAQLPDGPAPGSGGLAPANYVVNSFEITDNDHQGERSYSIETRKVRRAVQDEGATIIRSYPKIGVVVVESSDADFADRMRSSEYAEIVESVGATSSEVVQAPKRELDDMLRPALIDPEPLEGQQWGNVAVESLEANEIQMGSPDITVGVLDSGIDSSHEDLADAIDKDASVDCTNNGIENTDEAAWNPTSSTHGTHVAGTIGARRNGIGVAGMAPGVRLASVKVVNDDGWIYPEYALCGFMWAPKHGIDVTNNSYFIDPYEFWCADDPDQGAVQESVRRAVHHAQRRGILNVASAGNSALDLTEVEPGCLDMPMQLPGVLTVSATTSTGDKAGFSNYGDGIIDVGAPGQTILSTIWPSGYGSLSGTSMASPHVAGVAALALSQYPDLRPRELRKHIWETAVDVPCPDDPECTGNAAYNGFFGHGLVNALNAVQGLARDSR